MDEPSGNSDFNTASRQLYFGYDYNIVLKVPYNEPYFRIIVRNTHDVDDQVVLPFRLRI